MNLILVGSVVVICFESILIGFLIFNKIRKNNLIDKNTFLNIFPVSIILFLLYFLANTYNQDKFKFIFISNSLVSTVKTFAFEINSLNAIYLLDNNIWFAIAFYIAYALALLTILGATLGFIKEYLFNLFRRHIVKQKSSDIVIGVSETAIDYARKHRKMSIIWIIDADKEDSIDRLKQEKIAYIKEPFTAQNILKRFRNNVRYNFISFEAETSKYQILINEIISLINSHNNFYLFLEVNYNETEIVREQLIKHNDSKVYFYIRTFSRYQLIARKLLSNITIPKLLPKDFINPNHSIKNEKEINVFFLGLGKVNGNIFTNFIENNQLVTTIDNKLEAKLVNYYVIDDKVKSEFNNRIDYILDNISNITSDLPLPERLGNYHKFDGNLYDAKIINQIKKIANAKDSHNIFIVSFGTDLENIEMSVWLKEEFNQLNTDIICRSKNISILDSSIISFGNEEEVITHDNIVNNHIEQLAKDINSSYNKLKNQGKFELDSNWLKLPKIDFLSNFAVALNVYFKLNLLGYDLSNNKDDVSVSKEEFMKTCNKDIPFKLKYDDYFKATTKNVLAYGEKLRWNAFYLLNGYKPMALSKIDINKTSLNYTTKDINKKEHVCITSHLGLHELHKYVVDKFLLSNVKASIMDVELYKYDYMTFDDSDSNLYDLLIDKGYKIIPLKRFNIKTTI